MSRHMGLYLIETFAVGPLQCNCAIVADPSTREAVVVDPGDEPDRILDALSGAGLKPIALVHTHAHFDHVGCSALLKRITGAPIYMHEGDHPLYENLEEQGKSFGIQTGKPAGVDRLLVHGDRIAVGEGALHVLHTPGHTPGSLSFRMEGAGRRSSSGARSSWRSIAHGTSGAAPMDQILDSIPASPHPPRRLRVIPGHGPDTTIAGGPRNPRSSAIPYKPV